MGHLQGSLRLDALCKSPLGRVRVPGVHHNLFICFTKIPRVPQTSRAIAIVGIVIGIPVQDLEHYYLYLFSHSYKQ